MITLELPYKRKRDILKDEFDSTPLDQYGDETLKNIVLKTLNKDKQDRMTAK